MSAPTTSQKAAVTALRQCDDQIEMMRDERPTAAAAVMWPAALQRYGLDLL